MNYRILKIFAISILITSCGILDRGADKVVDLEPIPEETVTTGPSILIDDEEMIAAEDEYIDDRGLSRADQMIAEASGTFVGQKIDPLKTDYTSVGDAFDVHRDSYEEVKSRVYGAATEFFGTVAAINTKLQLGTTPGNPVLVRQYDQAQGELDNIEEYLREINLLNQKVNADAGVVALLKSTINKVLRLAGAIDQDHRQLEVLEDDVEKIREEIRLEKSKFKVKKEYFDLITLEEEIYIKNNKLHFLNLELSLTENYLIIKNKLNFNHLYISLNQGVLIETEGFNEISIKNNELKTTIDIKNIETEYIEDSSVELVINYQKFTLLFIEMFNIILLNKNFY